MSRAKFIPYARFSERAHPDFGTRIPVAISAGHVFIDIDFFARCADALALVFELDGFGGVIAVLLDMNNFGHDDVAVVELGILGNEPGRIDLVVIAVLDAFGFRGVRFAAAHEPGDVFVFVLFRVVNRRGKHPAINGTLVYQHTVFLVIAGIRHDGDMDDLTRGTLDEVQPVHNARIHQGS